MLHQFTFCTILQKFDTIHLSFGGRLSLFLFLSLKTKYFGHTMSFFLFFSWIFIDQIHKELRMNTKHKPTMFALSTKDGIFSSLGRLVDRRRRFIYFILPTTDSIGKGTHAKTSQWTTSVSFVNTKSWCWRSHPQGGRGCCVVCPRGICNTVIRSSVGKTEDVDDDNDNVHRISTSFVLTMTFRLR